MELNFLVGLNWRTGGLVFISLQDKEFEKAKTIEICGRDFHNLEIEYNSWRDHCGEVSDLPHGESIKWCWEAADDKYPNYQLEHTKCMHLKSVQ